MSTTTWCNIIPKLQVILEISNFEFFDGLVIYKGNLAKSVEWEFGKKSDSFSPQFEMLKREGRSETAKIVLGCLCPMCQLPRINFWEQSKHSRLLSEIDFARPVLFKNEALLDIPC